MRGAGDPLSRCECGRGVYVSLEFQQSDDLADWTGPQVCSFCGTWHNPDRTGCLGCGKWFATERGYWEHREDCLGVPNPVPAAGNPLSYNGSGYLETTGLDTDSDPRINAHENAQKPVGRPRLTIGGECSKGHTMTRRNLYISPRGRARCEDCRRARERV